VLELEHGLNIKWTPQTHKSHNVTSIM